MKLFLIIWGIILVASFINTARVVIKGFINARDNNTKRSKIRSDFGKMTRGYA